LQNSAASSDSAERRSENNILRPLGCFTSSRYAVPKCFRFCLRGWCACGSTTAVLPARNGNCFGNVCSPQARATAQYASSKVRRCSTGTGGGIGIRGGGGGGRRRRCADPFGASSGTAQKGRVALRFWLCRVPLVVACCVLLFCWCGYDDLTRSWSPESRTAAAARQGRRSVSRSVSKLRRQQQQRRRRRTKQRRNEGTNEGTSTKERTKERTTTTNCERTNERTDCGRFPTFKHSLRAVAVY